MSRSLFDYLQGLLNISKARTKARMNYFVRFWRDSLQWARTSSFTRFLDHTQRRTTVNRTPLDEWSARHRDLYLTTHNSHNRQTSMPPVGFEPTISAGEQPQTYALDRAATGTGALHFTFLILYLSIVAANCDWNMWLLLWINIFVLFVLRGIFKGLLLNAP